MQVTPSLQQGGTLHIHLNPPRVVRAVATLLTARCNEIGFDEAMLAQCTPLAMLKHYPYQLSPSWSYDTAVKVRCHSFASVACAT